MKILVPIDGFEEALPLIAAGADAFYCGLQLDGINLGTRRGSTHSYFKSFEDFQKLTQILKNG